MRPAIFILLLLIIVVKGYAQHRRIAGGEMNLQQLSTAPNPLLFDSRYRDTLPGLKDGKPRDRNIIHVLTLRVNPALGLALAQNFTVSLVLDVESGNDINSLKHETKKLQVTYTTAGQYVAVDAFEEENVSIVQYKRISLSVTDGHGTVIPVSDANKDIVLLKQELRFDRYLVPDRSAAGKITTQQVRISPDGGYARLSWSPMPWALSYDIEYTYVDNYTGSVEAKVLPGKTSYDFRFNNTRISLTDTSYEIPMVYETGYVLWRVRGVGRWGGQLEQTVTGRWSFPDSGKAVSGAGPEGVFYCVVDKTGGVHEGDMKNWQYIASFAEEGRRKDVVSYLDGTLRSRQSVIDLTTEKSLLVNETIYDHSGRAAIDILPTPVLAGDSPTAHIPRIEYQKDIALNVGGDPYSWKDFDTNRGCLSFPDKMSTTAGAGQYYSGGNHFDLSKAGVRRQLAYVADAAGFPFSEKEYMPDNSGRIRRQGGPGPDYKLGKAQEGTHEEKFYYGVPAQEELDRVFGNEAGFADHYVKETRLDANGQSYLTYKDLRGNVVATAMSGAFPGNVTPLNVNTAKKRITVHLIDEHNNRVDESNNSIMSVYPLVLTETDTLQLKYNLFSPGLAFPICARPDSLCYDCVYDLSIKITDDCGNAVFNHTVPIGTLKNLRACENGDLNVQKETPVVLPLGSYMVTKVLSVSDSAVESYVKDYLADTCWDGLFPPGPPADCQPVACKFDTLHSTHCVNNEAARMHIPPYDFLPAPKEMGDTDCMPPPVLDTCAKLLQRMLADLSPGGQYASYPHSTPGDIFPDITSYPLSILNPLNKLPSRGNYTQPVGFYRNDNGSVIKVANGSAAPVGPEKLGWAAFVDNWKPSMAYALLPYHPEYCYYEWNSLRKDYLTYHSELAGDTSYAQAGQDFPILITKDFDVPDTSDPLFLNNRVRTAEMKGYMGNFATYAGKAGNIKLFQLASLAAAGFSDSSSDNDKKKYLLKHTFYKDVALQDEEWRQFRTYYLLARTRILEEARRSDLKQRFSSDSGCCLLSENIGNAQCKAQGDKVDQAVCALYANKIPVFPDQDRAGSLIGAGIAQSGLPVDTPNICHNCAGAGKLQVFFNRLLQQRKLLAVTRLYGALLSAVAGKITDSIIARGGTILWMPNPDAHGLGGRLICGEDSSFIDTVSLETADTAFHWSEVIGFSCMKAASGGNYSLKAWTSRGMGISMDGHTDLPGLAGCTGMETFSITSRLKEYTGEFLQMLGQALQNVHGLRLPMQLVTGRTPPNPIYPDGSDPASLWFIDNDVTVSTDFTIPLTFRREIHGDHHSIRIRAKNPYIFNSFSDWRIASCDPIVVPQGKAICADVNSVKVVLARRDWPSSTDTIVVDFDLPLADYCEKDRIDSFCCMPIMPALPVIKGPDCQTVNRIQDQNNREMRIDSLKRQMADQLRRQYILHCLKPVELFDVSYKQQKYQFTLRYYDQAGNLLETVPPGGVQLLSDAQVEHARLVRQGLADTAVFTSHSMKTKYRYNSLNSVVFMSSPDDSVSRSCYDELGRVIYRQDAEQAHNQAVRRASFFLYDRLGRLYQTGQIPIAYDELPSQLSYDEFLGQIETNNEYKTDVFTTLYDNMPADIYGGFDIDLTRYHFRHLRNRVAANIYHHSFVDHSPYTQAYFYSYDIEGNADTVLQDFRHLDTYGVLLNFCGSSLFHRLKTIAYSYGPVSKNVTSVWYQPGAPDQLIHYYDYDADNRLARVRTATRAWSDSVTWEEDARYHYYPHGPLARLELGAEKIQGLDYAYTLQGWMKGMNSSTLDPTRDIGRDDATDYLRDVVAYGLNYYDGDYTPAGKTPFMPDITGTKLETDPFSPPLFDGAVRNLITANAWFAGKGVIQTTAYRYDALMRLKAMRVYQPQQNTAPVWKDSGYSKVYRSNYNYDANGNIKDIVRNNESGSVMDNVHFTYAAGNSHLISVYDSAGRKSRDDLDRDNSYTYDADGRLVRETEGPTNPLLLINSWTSFGRVLNINRNGKNMELEYNAFLQRAWEYNAQTGTATYYVRDLQGNALAVYSLASNMSVLDEWPLYGSKRLGSWPVRLDLSQPAHPDQLTYVRGVKSYELTNYLDNVMATVSDRRIPVAGGWAADIRKGQDYYPYGQRMPGRGCDTCYYRYGFNGKESDDSVKGLGNELDYAARIYDPQIGRFLSTDAYKKAAIGWSTYRFGFDNPIRYNDATGNQEEDGSGKKKEEAKPAVGSMTKYDLDQNVQELSFLPGIKQTIETTTTQTVGTEGSLLTVGGHLKKTGEFNLEGNVGGLTLEDGKVGPKVGGVSVRLGLNESEAKVEIDNSYFGIKTTALPPSIEIFQGQKTALPAKPPYSDLTKMEQDVKTSYKTTNALAAAVVAATVVTAAVVLAPVEITVAIPALLLVH